MAENVISVSGLSKWFRKQRPPEGLRESVATAISNRFANKTPQGFWALKDINFDVHCGEVLGIIGHNGAGKSVLLKILAGITSPTEGRAEIHGHIGALLELGTGFHPELSGYDNVFLNGSFLGLSRGEVAGKLDTIIDFSGVRDAIFEPIKHYSSGMTMRLAFSVAVNLAPEVIFLDEVWAVGDLDFQKRAFEKMKQIISEGRTVVMVSHALGTVAEFANSCLWLDHGRMVEMGPAGDVIKHYEASVRES